MVKNEPIFQSLNPILTSFYVLLMNYLFSDSIFSSRKIETFQVPGMYHTIFSVYCICVPANALHIIIIFKNYLLE
jgi:hypothetical protein